MRKITILVLSFFIGTLAFSNVLDNTTVEIPVQYESVEVKPLFPGGISEFMKFVMKNYQVPEEDEGGATGTVQVSIIIDVDGSVTQVNILKDVGNAGKEIKRVLAKCPKWTPGRQKGTNVAVMYNFPITIK